MRERGGGEERRKMYRKPKEREEREGRKGRKEKKEERCKTSRKSKEMEESEGNGRGRVLEGVKGGENKTFAHSLTQSLVVGGTSRHDTAIYTSLLNKKL